jgi:hypothetical protein
MEFNGGCEGIKVLFWHSSSNTEEHHRTLHTGQPVELPRYKQLTCKLQNTTYRTAGRSTEIQTPYTQNTRRTVPTALSVHTAYRYQLQLRRMYSGCKDRLLKATILFR